MGAAAPTWAAARPVWPDRYESGDEYGEADDERDNRRRVRVRHVDPDDHSHAEDDPGDRDALNQAVASESAERARLTR